MNDEAENYEEGYKGGIYGERDSGRERIEWISDHTRITCVILYGKIPFWNLVVRAVGLIVTGFGGEVSCGGGSP